MTKKSLLRLRSHLEEQLVLRLTRIDRNYKNRRSNRLQINKIYTQLSNLNGKLSEGNGR